MIDAFPKRPLLVLVMATIAWGSLTLFQKFRASLPTPKAVENVRADAQSEYAIAITLTFDAQGDAFNPLALRVSLDGVAEPLFESKTTVRAGVAVLISPVAGIKVGVNELLIEVGSGTDSSVDSTNAFGSGSADREITEAAVQQVAHAIRVQVLANEEVIVDQTLWSEPDDAVSGLILIDVPENSDARSTPVEHAGPQH
ncbi:MAG: hypothetical protein HON92_04085 [Planctomycetaceae bacterium]|jgi:hypothetical protein|nr:hypothetical protein [Planctomycetaceae bacterium]MBT4844592.1 hypothetical protein [Planctomycetaceae bacterium]MBT5597511.1 hypothetical protein [Planctomycetaceae bacterium]MBT5882952.1 hypothetical protein [Planctomycetaceae bacterium]MBT6848726.1 hypothetical protein [Planctomycetaceae bacterium]